MGTFQGHGQRASGLTRSQRCSDQSCAAFPKRLGCADEIGTLASTINSQMDGAVVRLDVRGACHGADARLGRRRAVR